MFAYKQTFLLIATEVSLNSWSKSHKQKQLKGIETKSPSEQTEIKWLMSTYSADGWKTKLTERHWSQMAEAAAATNSSTYNPAADICCTDLLVNHSWATHHRVRYIENRINLEENK